MNEWWLGLAGEHYWMEITERNDLSKEMPKRAAELDALLATYLADVGANMPVPNPQFDPTRAPTGRPQGGGKGGRRVDPVLAAIDTDGDGKLSAAEIKASARSLRQLDKNQDGSVSRDEVNR